MSYTNVTKSRQCLTYIKIIWKIFHAINWEPFYSEVLHKHSKIAFYKHNLEKQECFSATK